MAFSLSRNAKLYVSTVKTGFSTANTWKIEVLDGFSFPANVSIQEVTVSEAGTDPIRGQQAFTTSIDPVDWSFSSYVRPYLNTNVLAPELIMWDAMSSADGTGLTEGPTSTVVDFTASNKNQIQLLQMYFDLGGEQWYHIEDAVVNTAEFDFGIDQIAMIAWSGQAKVVNKVGAATPATLTDVQTMRDSTQFVDIPAQTGFLQNKLTTVEMLDLGDQIATDTDGATSGNTTFTSAGASFTDALIGDYLNITSGSDTGFYRIEATTGTTLTLDTAMSGTETTLSYQVVRGYDIALTGGNLSVTNNITFLTPESLGVLNTPITHFTGTRGVSGSMSVYLKTGLQDSGTADLFKQISEDFATITQNYRLLFHVGGPKTATNRIDFELAHAHLVVPVIDVQDVISLNVDFTGLPHNGTDFDLESTNELVVEYFAT